MKLNTMVVMTTCDLRRACRYPGTHPTPPRTGRRPRWRADLRGDPGERYALLLCAASPDAEGALGGLVQEARRIGDHVRHALRTAVLCSNDPVCAEHVPGDGTDPH